MHVDRRSNFMKKGPNRLQLFDSEVVIIVYLDGIARFLCWKVCGVFKKTGMYPLRRIVTTSLVHNS